MYTMLVICIIAALLLIGYAAICNAKMDTVKDHYSTSIYSDATKYNPVWFNPELSWENKDIINGQHKAEVEALQKQNLPWTARWIVNFKVGWDPISDFWHWQKTQMLLSLIGSMSVVLFSSWFIEGWGALYQRILTSVLYFIAAGVAWNVYFNFFYNSKLKK